MPKRSSVTPTYSAVERLVFEMPRPDGVLLPEAEAEWAKLWQDHIEGQNLAHTDVEEASLLCSLGWQLAVQRQDFQAALARAARWFEHPQRESADEFTRQYLLSLLAQAHLHLGEEASALEELGVLLGMQRPYHPESLYLVRGILYHFLREQPAQERAPAEMVGLAAQVVGRFRGRARLARSIVAGRTSFGQIAAVLEQTYSEPPSAARDRAGGAGTRVDTIGGEAPGQPV